MLLKVFSTLLCTQVIYALTEVKECKAPPGQVIPESQVQYGDCVTPPCLGKRGTDTTVEMVFVAVDDYASVIVEMYGSMMGIKHGYPGIDGSNGCPYIYSMPDKTPVGCPIEKGKQYMFQITFPIKKTFPKVTVPIHMAAKEKSTNKIAACYETILKVV